MLREVWIWSSFFVLLLLDFTGSQNSELSCFFSGAIFCLFDRCQKHYMSISE